MIILSLTSPPLKTTISPHLYELRLDLTSTPYHIPDFFYHHPTIITLRDSSQGGHFTGDIHQKLAFLTSLLDIKNFYIDIEFTHFHSLSKYITHKNHYKKIIFSIHDTSPFDLQRAINHIKQTKIITDCFFTKYVFQIDTYTQLLDIVGAVSDCHINHTLLSSGKLSLITRTLYAHLHSKVTYCCLPDCPTAPNQITTDAIATYNIKNITPETQVGGIIGNSQITHSLGIPFYNKYFADHRINAVYLPFVTDDCEDLIHFIKNSKISFYGFSITSPHKETMTKHISTDKPMINLWLPPSDHTDLTDTIALKIAFRKLNITTQTVIHIAGSGAIASIIPTLLPKNEIHYLPKIPRYTIPTLYDSHKPDVCVINATPLGQNGENLLIYYHIPTFHKVIDLAYTVGDTPLIRYCKIGNLPYVDGHTFWIWQAKPQLEAFLQGICYCGAVYP